ncbi:related to Het-c heterokaryon incompatibility protein [Serendipita indica DSM 11827]|uniref:Related to Het-c heterokaryon incompatibility protein n=1 Tax=Serendipita indica (strain DSM 11827) TaxID=1109443 RepID=G4T7Q4_SERID|nr:related to Het-c heterokaryon incompatibility protein [Serendipita indica DSM 11827]
MPSILFWLLVIAFVLAVLPTSAHAFGAGNLPSYAYLEDKAFRHGDIEDVLAELLKRTGSGLLKQGSKFKGLDIKRVYFGNWLRDYSQAVDVAGLKATTIQNIITICTVLGFMAHGFVTDEFEVTEERLGVYLPVEHIDNPKGYPDDARKYHPKLRGPVDPRELEIDLRTGMKNYIANEDGGWDTSRALVRRRLQECINIGRRYRSTHNKADQYEAFRLLGSALHTMEDFPAHSNFCELALVSMGCNQVFTHVGDNVRIPAPNGKFVAPLVTGTFGGDDFQHSLLGEAGDHISQSSISDLNEHVNKARAKSASGDFGSANKIKALIATIPSPEAQSMSRDIDTMQANRATPGKDPNTMTPKELYQNIWAILSFRDSVVKKMSYGIEKIPGLGPLIDSIMENLTVFVIQTLEPYLKPLMKTATTQLAASSAAVINKLDQYEVFHDPNASDPTHSILSKDHFNLILNEPAGNLAKIIVIHTVKLVVHAWDHAEDNIHHVTETILECMFHPDFHNPRSSVQKEMMEFMRQWLSTHSAGHHDVLSRLTKEAIRNHQNVRKQGDSSGSTVSSATHGHGAAVGYGHQASAKISNTLHSIPGVNQVQNFVGHMPGGGHFPSRDMPGYAGGPPEPSYSAPSTAPGASSYNAPPSMPGASPYGAPPSMPSASAYGSSHNAPSHTSGYPGASYDMPKGHDHGKKHKNKGSDSDNDKPKKDKKKKNKNKDSDSESDGKPKKDKKDKHKHGYDSSYGQPSYPSGGYNPSHNPPAHSPPTGAPSFPGAPSSGVGFPGAPSFPGSAPGYTAPSGYGGPPSYDTPPQQYGAAPSFPGGPSPGFPSGPYGQPQGGPPGFPGAYPGGPPPQQQFPGQGYNPQPPYGGQW